MKTQEQINFDREQRGRDRRKKYLYLKRTHQLGNYYYQMKHLPKRVPIAPQPQPALTWFDKLKIRVKAFFKTLDYVFTKYPYPDFRTDKLNV